jgi:hypothetical protein
MTDEKIVRETEDHIPRISQVLELIRNACGTRANYSGRNEDIFIETLLTMEGDEGVIIEDATERLLCGEPAPEFDLSVPADSTP